ncbi:MAG: hypothetical protein QXU67_01665 [Candidatus Bathyarchaeia archaeon]|nr:hypothetical protein [Candidatus Bathyarchaeota archaeon]
MIDYASMIGIHIAAIFTIACLSFLFKDNVVFHTVESIFIGTSVAYIMTFSIEAIRKTAWVPLLKGELIWIFPMILGVLYLTRLSPQIRWISRYPVSLLVGIGTGLAARAVLQVNLLAQIEDTVRIRDLTATGIINITVVFLGVILGILYFVFTFRPKGTLEPLFNYLTRGGRIIIMAAFGSMYGNTVLGRFSLLIGRLQFLLWDWLKLGAAT